MKTSTLVIILLVIVVLMIHAPNRTSLEITTGEKALTNLGESAAGGFFLPPSKSKG